MNALSFSKLYRIFIDKKWNEKDGNKIVFDKFCQLLSNLSEVERNLIIELTERYTWITYSEYSHHLTNVFNKIEDEKLKSLKRIILFPIMRPEDERKTKSGHEVLYAVYAFKPFLQRYKHIIFTKIETFEEITADSFTIRENEAIFLVDDYLGSGETIKATLDEILKNRNIKPNNLSVISISAQKESFDYIKSLGISVYTDHVSRKGISDYYSQPILEEKVAIMLKIEKLIPKNRFRFGYNRSEALITLMRTPNNTFPIFWKEYKKNGSVFAAPFSRY